MVQEIGRRNRTTFPLKQQGRDLYTRWERHKLAVRGLRRTCAASILAFPASLLAEYMWWSEYNDYSALAPGAIATLLATLASIMSYFYVYYWGKYIKRPFLISALLLFGVTSFIAFCAARTGGAYSPYSFGLIPVLLIWAMLMPGGARDTTIPMLGGYLTYQGALYILGELPLGSGQVQAALFIQFMGVIAGVVVSEFVETWRRRLALHSITDALTQLMSRRYLLQRMDEMGRFRRRYPAPTSVILFDADYFKRVNDTFGHAAGDDVLKTIAAVMLKSSRKTDLCGRYGGEEFVMVLDGCDTQVALEMAEHIRTQIEETAFVVRSQKVAVTISAGVATVEAGIDMDTAAILKLADEALYVSKENGRNQTTIHETAR